MKVPHEFRQRLDDRFAGLATERGQWWAHWRECATYILPRRYRWLNGPNEAGGDQINRAIKDSTGTIAARTCSSGMMAGVTSPTRPWFKLQIEGFEAADDSNAVSLWLAECERRMRRVFAESNFYQAIGVMYEDLVTFGTAAMLCYEDRDDVVRFYNPSLGEYYLANGARGSVNGGGTFAREFVYTVTQLVERFGKENLPEQITRLYTEGGAGLRQPYVVRHILEPNEPPDARIPKKFNYREYYWLRGIDNDTILEAKGFFEFPGMFPRWSLTGNDAYGRGPGMDALPDIRQLQQEQLRKAEAIDKMVRPPMVGDVQLKNQPASLLPGGITFVSGASAGFKPAFDVRLDIQALLLDIQEVQARIRSIFFNDLFMMISQLNSVRSATEIDARREEKLVMLGPVLERFENEALDPVINRVFGIMSRGGLLPPPPEEIRGREIQIQYVSMLAEAQRAASSAGLERFLQFGGGLAAVKPTVLDIIDEDEVLYEYGTIMGVSPKTLRDRRAVMAKRAQDAQRANMMQSAQAAMAGVEGAKTLSETDVGGGVNALQMMLGGGS